jgi:replication-associated recombination protein RarA
VIGHTAARTILERQLPTAVLLHGPASIGKWTLATHLATHHKVHAIDRWSVDYGFNIETVRAIAAFTARPPVGRFKLIIGRLDDSNRKALNALLKTLEEPPPQVKFIFTSATNTMPTIASRCAPFPLGALTRDELEAIYLQQGMPSAKARQAAAFARGQVSRGYEMDSATTYRIQIVAVARAIATSDRELFTTAFKTWDGHSTDMLLQLLTECLTCRWVTYTEADASGLHRDRHRLWQIVAAVTRPTLTRARLGIRAALEPFLKA